MPSKTTTATATAKETKAKETKAKETKAKELRGLREQAGLLTSEGDALRRLEQGLRDEIAVLKRDLHVAREPKAPKNAAPQEPRRMFEDRPLSKLERRFMDAFEAAARVRPRMPRSGERELDAALLAFIEVVEGGRRGIGLRQQWFWPGETAQEG